MTDGFRASDAGQARRASNAAQQPAEPGWRDVSRAAVAVSASVPVPAEPGWRAAELALTPSTPDEQEQVLPLAYGAGVAPQMPPGPLLAPDGSSELFHDDVLTSADDPAMPDQAGTNRRLMTGLVAVSALLVLAVVALIFTTVARPARAPATVTVTQTAQVAVSYPELATSDNAGLAGNALGSTRFGTVLLPADQAASANIMNGDTQIVAMLSSGTNVMVGTLAGMLGSGELPDLAQGWAANNGVVLDEASGAMRTSALGYQGWCATSNEAAATAAPTPVVTGGQVTYTTTLMSGRGCFYTTPGGGSFIWVWTPIGSPDASAQALLDAYVPGN